MAETSEAGLRHYISMVRIDIGRNVKRLRLQQGRKQEDVALAAGYKSRSSLSKIELGRRLPSVIRLIQLAYALGVPLSTLTGRRPPRRPASIGRLK